MYTVVLLYIRGRYHYFIVNDLYRKPTDTSLWRVSHNKDLLLLLLFTHVYHSIIVHCMPLYILFTHVHHLNFNLHLVCHAVKQEKLTS